MGERLGAGTDKTQTTGCLVVPLVVPLEVPLVVPLVVPWDGVGTSVTSAGGTDGSEVMLGDWELQVRRKGWGDQRGSSVL